MKKTKKTLRVRADSWIDALQHVALRLQGSERIVRVATRRVRILAMPEKVTTSSGQRDFGRERRHARTAGWAIIRSFVIGS